MRQPSRGRGSNTLLGVSLILSSFLLQGQSCCQFSIVNNQNDNMEPPANNNNANSNSIENDNENGNANDNDNQQSEEALPIAVAGSDQIVNEGQTVVLNGSASTGTSLTFTWIPLTGPSISLADAHAAMTTFQAPQVNSTTAITLRLRAEDSLGRTSLDDLVVSVKDVPAVNRSPIANAGVDKNADEETLVQLDGSGSTDPDGDALTFKWTQNAGPVVALINSTSPNASFTAPEVEGDVPLTFDLTVRDTALLGSIDTITITVKNTTAALRVTPGVGAGGDGLSWPNAMHSVDAAIQAAQTLAGKKEVWVAAGTYTPAGPNGDRGASFNLVNHVALLGGFSGTETFRSQRNPDANPTILSGDLNNNDLANFANNNENSFHVVRANGVDGTALLDGFSVIGGNANASGDSGNGGGLFCLNEARPTIGHCTFAYNSAISQGGALYWTTSTGTPFRITQCVFSGNRAGDADLAAEGYGGAIAGAVMVSRCRFLSNSAHGRGGALYQPKHITNCLFAKNFAEEAGGAVFVDTGISMAANSVFAGNVSGLGGAILCNSTDSMIVRNCTVANNSVNELAGPGGGLAGRFTVRNSILWNNTNQTGLSQDTQLWGLIDLRYSCVQALSTLGGIGNTNQNPGFADLDGPDNVLGTEDDDFRLGLLSPGFGTGSNSEIAADFADLDADGDTLEPVPLDLDEAPRIKNGVVDMGAYESD